MNVKKYITQTCEYTEASPDLDEYGSRTNSNPCTIGCFRLNSENSSSMLAFVINGDSVNFKSKLSYLIIDNRVKVGDLLDGLTVSAVDPVYDFDGKLVYSVASVG